MIEHEFKVGDQVAHQYHGNGIVIGFEHFSGIPEVEFDSGLFISILARDLRPRNFLSRIAEEQKLRDMEQEAFENWLQDKKPYGDIETVHGLWEQSYEYMDFIESQRDCSSGVKTFDQQFNEVFSDRIQRNAYGQLVDTVTGLDASSDGLVAIKSIRDTVREIS